MNAVGIDVSKGKSTVTILRPMGEVVQTPIDVSHDAVSLERLAFQILSLGENTRVVMEATGRYHEPVATELHDHGIFVSVVNPLAIHGYCSGGTVRKVKNDQKDSLKIAKFALDHWVDLREYTPMDAVRQQLKIFSRQYNLYMKSRVALQSNLISLTDKVFPGVNEIFTSPERSDGHMKWVDFVTTFWHCKCISLVSENAFTERYKKWCKRMGYHFSAAKAYDRLIAPSMERELRTALTDEANEGAIRNFALNLRPLLMQPPVKGHVTMGLDPGYSHGCKVAVVDATGKVLDTAVVYPTFSKAKRDEAITRLAALVRKHGVEHIAIGNGTASRETENAVCELLGKVSGVSYMIVSEAGASVYSASPLAAEEFPQYDVNLRSAVSIARRMQDPLAELVKIDPKAIGVGQYQHDLPEKRLDEALGGVVEDCVNAVGVDLNTASVSLLRRVSGLNATTAKNIVAYREENGAFTARKQVLKVPKLGAKAYEQAAGFLRVPESKQILDNTGVHPESYDAAEKLLVLCGYTLQDVADGKLAELPKRAEAFGMEQAAKECGVGVPTLRDIIKELCKPGRDPRDELPAPILRTDVLEMKDLKPGMVLTGTVRNVIDFGVFVDIGVHQDGMVHISRVCDRYIKHPSEVVSVGDIVKVAVLEVDEKRKRISLTMRDLPKENQSC